MKFLQFVEKSIQDTRTGARTHTHTQTVCRHNSIESGNKRKVGYQKQKKKKAVAFFSYKIKLQQDSQVYV